MAYMLFASIFTDMSENLRVQLFMSNPLGGVFMELVCPLFFIKAGMKHCKSRMKLYTDSLVQLVELTLNPKTILKA